MQEARLQASERRRSAVSSASEAEVSPAKPKPAFAFKKPSYSKTRNFAGDPFAFSKPTYSKSPTNVVGSETSPIETAPSRGSLG